MWQQTANDHENRLNESNIIIKRLEKEVLQLKADSARNQTKQLKLVLKKHLWLVQQLLLLLLQYWFLLFHQPFFLKKMNIFKNIEKMKKTNMIHCFNASL